MRIAAVSCLLLFGVLASSGLAQPSPTPAPTGTPSTEPAGDDLPPLPPPPPSYPTSASDQPQPAPAAECVPACRSGYACVSGACVPACNPPCGPNEQCTANGECSAGASGAPPPKYFGGSDAPWVDAPKKGVEQHDGFMLRLTLGVGGATNTQKASLPPILSLGSSLDTEASGVAISFSLDLGASVADGLVLHARLADMVVPQPNITQNGQDLGTPTDSGVGATFLGPALSYYFMPINIYITGAVGLSWTGLRRGDGSSNTDSRSSDVGLGLNLDIGKEWWVSDNWGLGVAARLWYTTLTNKEDLGISSTADDTVTTDFKLAALAVLFSATYQ